MSTSQSTAFSPGKSPRCRVCQDLDANDQSIQINQWQAFSLRLAYGDLISSHNCGCCILLVEIFRFLWKDSTKPLDMANPVVTVSVPVGEDSGRHVAASFDAPDPRPVYAAVEEQCIDLTLTASEKCETFPFRALPPGGFVPQDSRSEITIGQIYRWLQTCCHAHKSQLCRISQEYASYSRPTRLIAVPTEGQPAILVETRSISNIRYAALSYCWGPKPTFITTRRATLQERFQGIPWKLLPRTFQDSLVVCHALGITYLWIDALCIIQDDGEDWTAESGRMGDIYKHAHLVISADHGPNAEMGLFTQRSGTWEFGIKDWVSVRRPGKVYVQRRVSHNVRYYPPSILDGGRWPLSTRGWCVQERLMASRIVHFTADEVFWECAEGLQCECRFLDNQAEHKSTGLSFKKAVSRMTPDQKAAGWCEIVQIYSSKVLTKDTDRFPAISALALEFANNSDKACVLGDYIAGIWSRYIPAMISWQSAGFGTKVHRRSSEYLAPTWSWASVLGPVVWQIKQGAVSENIEVDMSRYAVDVVDVSCQSDQRANYGRCYSGALTLRSPTLTTHVKLDKDRPRLKPPEHSMVILDVSTLAGQCEVEDGEQVKCIFMEKLERTPVEGILLRHSRREEGSYERVARVYLHDREDLHDLRTEVLKII